MKNNIFYKNRWRVIIDLLLLYMSKSGAIVVGIFILPWYQKLLGASDFGLVVLVMALQAFFLMMDLGVSTLVGRELSTRGGEGTQHSILKTGELLLHFFYILLLFLALALNAILDFKFSFIIIFLCVIFFWALAVQNVGQAALIACGKYYLAAIAQIIGVLARASFTLFLLTYVSGKFEYFLLGQSVIAVLQMLLTIYFCNKTIEKIDERFNFKEKIPVVVNLLKKGVPLVAFGLAGAAVMQMDKVIIGVWGNTKAVAAYYLASTLCLVPVSVLAGPIAQYFQPKIIGNITGKKFQASNVNLKFMIAALVVAVLLPSLILWINSGFFVHIWLRGQSNVDEVAHYVRILLPGVAIGSFGFVSYIVLIAYQDYKAQAMISTLMTIITLGATAFFVKKNNIDAICFSYSMYHIISAFLCWLRACYLQFKDGSMNFFYKGGMLFFLMIFALLPVILVNGWIV